MMHFKNVLCVYPHQEGLPEKKYCPPIGLEYIATILEDLVEKVTIIDMRFEPNIDNFIKDDNVDMVCLSVNWDYQRDAALNIVARIPPKIKVVLGGRYATTCLEELFATAPNIDCIVRGDGEEIMRDIASGFPLQNVTGISYRQGNRIIHNAVRDFRQLDDTIYPNRKLRRAKYKLLYKNIDLGKSVDFISTSRGCPFNCKFCTFSNNPLGQKRNWSARSPLSVIAELKTIDAEFVLVVDDNFAADIKRVEKKIRLSGIIFWWPYFYLKNLVILFAVVNFVNAREVVRSKNPYISALLCSHYDFDRHSVCAMNSL